MHKEFSQKESTKIFIGGIAKIKIIKCQIGVHHVVGLIEMIKMHILCAQVEGQMQKLRSMKAW